MFQKESQETDCDSETDFRAGELISQGTDINSEGLRNLDLVL